MRKLLVCVFLVAACGDDDTAVFKVDLSGAVTDMAMNNPGVDSSVPDLSPLTPSGMIAQARMMADSAMTPDGGTIALPIEDVLVTYLKPLIGTDSAGFFIQAEMAGPALFIAVDPATLTPAPKVGDQVSFTITAIIKDGGGVREARSISDWMVSSSGNSLTGLLQDLSSAADLVSGVDNYESELARVEGDIAAAFTSSGTGFVQAAITTAGVPAASTSLRLRLPATVRDAVDASNGCHFVLASTPLWRFNKVAQPSGWVAGDIAITNCPAPKVVSAKALSATSVAVTFDRNIDMATATAGQFTFNNGLTTSAVASVAGPVVTLTTSNQTSGQDYTVTVGASVKDLTGNAVNAAANTAAFKGFAAPASLIITEFNPNITGADQIELKALTAGTISGYSVFQDFTAARTRLSDLPDVVVAANDFIVLHLSPPPSPTPLVTETTDKTSCTDPTCVATAWDVAATTGTGLSFTRHLISLVAPNGMTVDVVSYTKKTGGSANAGTELQAAIDAGLWTTACAASPCNATTDFDAASVDVSAIGNSVQSNTPQRKNTTLPSGLSSWNGLATPSWGM